MNRGFAYYFGRAFKTSMTTIWKNRNVFKSVAYLFMDLAALVTLVFRPMFSMAGVTQAKAAQKTGEFNISPAFKEASKPQTFWTMAMACVIEGLILLGGLVVCAVIVGALALLSSAIGAASSASSGTQSLLLWLFIAPGLLLTLFYCCVMAMIFAPTAYVVESNPGINAADVVSICFNTMKANGKLVVFLTALITMGIALAIIGVCAVVTYVIYALVPAGAVKLFIICVWLLVAAAIVSLTMPTLILTKNLAFKDLFEDIAQDPVNASKRTAGITIKNVTGAEFEYETINEQLVSMFDETQDDSVPLPVRKAQKKARADLEKGMDEGAKRAKKHKGAKPAMDINVDQAPAGATPVGEVPTQAATAGETFEAPAPAPAQPAPQPAADAQAVANLIDDEPTPAPQPQAAPEQPIPQPVPEPQPAQPAAQPAPQPAPEPQPQPQPAPNPFANAGAASSPFGGANPAGANPFGTNAGAANPVGTNPANPANPAGAANNPFANPTRPDPFAGAGARPNPFASSGAARPNPFASGGAGAAGTGDTAGLSAFEIRARERARRMAERAAANGQTTGNPNGNGGTSEE